MPSCSLSLTGSIASSVVTQTNTVVAQAGNLTQEFAAQLKIVSSDPAFAADTAPLRELRF